MDLYEVEKKDIEAAIVAIQHLGFPIAHYGFDEQLGQWVLHGSRDNWDSKVLEEWTTLLEPHGVFLAGWRVEPEWNKRKRLAVLLFWLRVYVNK